MFGFYTFGYANSDTSGISGFASEPPTTSARTTAAVRSMLGIESFLGGSVALPYLIRLSPFMVISSGSPYTITSPLDINGDQIYNDRPSLVSSATCPTSVNPTQGSTINCTPLGPFDASGAGKVSPVNSETGPNHFVKESLDQNLRNRSRIKSGHQQSESGWRTPGGGGGRAAVVGSRGPLFGGGGGGFNTQPLPTAATTWSWVSVCATRLTM